jgi:hypothetical protein
MRDKERKSAAQVEEEVGNAARVPRLRVAAQNPLNFSNEDSPAQRISALAQTIEVIKGTYVEDIDQKDRIIQMSVDQIERELTEL